MYYGLRRAIEDTVDVELQARSDNLAEFLKTKGNQQGATTPHALPQPIGATPGDDLYQVTDAAGTMLYQSPAMQSLNLPLNPAQMRHHYRHHRDDGNFTTYYHRQGDVRVLASTVFVGSNEYRVQVALVVSPLYEVLESFGTWTWTGLPIILCIAGLGGYWLSGRAMEPVRNLVAATRQIDERNLSKRLQVPAAKDELSELANTINAMLQRLEQAFTKITRFTSDASHELRTPVAVMRTTAEVTLERERTPPEYRDLVGQILQESEAASALIEQLLTLARADADTESLSFEDTDLRELVEEVARWGKTDRSDLHWSCELPETPLFVLGDRAHLRRLLLILIDNARRYTKRDGSVTIRLRAQSSEAEIEVVDTGIGIPADELIHIFDRFYRASNARFFDPSGSGLGLSIAYWIANAHKGSLTARSSFRAGSTLTVRLPIARLAGS